MHENESLSLIKQRKQRPSAARRRNWLRDSPRDHIAFNLAQYHSFAEVINYLNALAITYPDRVQVMPIGTTHEGRQIPLIKVICPSCESCSTRFTGRHPVEAAEAGNMVKIHIKSTCIHINNVSFRIDGGIHARGETKKLTQLMFF